VSLLQSKPAGMAQPAGMANAKATSSTSSGSLSSAMLARKGDARPGQRYMPEAGLEIPERTRVIKFGAEMLATSVPVPAVEAPVAAAPAIVADVFEPFADALEFPAYDDVPIEPVLQASARLVAVPACDNVEIPVEAPWQPLTISLPERARKSAFTLRLDSERHLRLRLLSAHQHRSAQQIVIEAVDRLLADVFDPLMASGRLSATLPAKNA
jgi:predicted DNA-binding protein